MTAHEPTQWTQPGPGQWQADNAHQTRPHGRFFDGLYKQPYEEGFAEGAAAVGAPLKGIEYATVNGWLYHTMRPLGGPAEPKGPPPKLVMWLLFKLVPAMRRRKRTATGLFERRPWAAQAETWFATLRPDFEVRLQALSSTPLTTLDAEGLAAHLIEVCDYGRAICRMHFAQVPPQAVALGDFLNQTTRWTGKPAVEILPACAGYSASASRPMVLLDGLVAALDAAGQLELLDGDVSLSPLRAASSEAAAALDAYLREFGDSPLGGESPLYPTVSERPDTVVASLRARRATRFDDGALRALGDEHAARLRDAVPAGERERWDQMLADARVATNVRDSDGALFFRWLGHLRHTLLACGELLVAGGQMSEAESAFDVTEGEILDLLRGGGPSRSEIAALTALRRHQETLTPPPMLGPDLGPPPIDRFPAPVARVTAAVMAFASRLEAHADPIAQAGLAGHGISPGIIEGTARIVRGPGDFGRVRPGDVLIARTTSGSFNVVLAMAGAVVTEVGGLISHAAIIAREFGMPGIVGCAGVLNAVQDGARVRVDGTRGTVTVLGVAAPGATPPASTPTDEAPARTPQVPASPGRVVSLTEAGQVAVYGGKAAHLAALLGDGIAVPDGVALDPAFVEAVAAGDPEHVRRLDAALATVARPVAVRSSGVAEDGRGASFAGQYRTVLGASTIEEIAAAVGTVWASAHSAGVRAYCERMGLGDTPPQMAVVIQPLVAADVAGVLFDEETAGRMIVEAVHGLGETLVDGRVTPDRFELDGDGVLARTTRGTQAEALRLTAAGKVERQAIAACVAACLDEAQLKRLGALALACRRVFGAPQDIEWAFVGGELTCLQSRPVTRALPEAARRTA